MKIGSLLAALFVIASIAVTHAEAGAAQYMVSELPVPPGYASCKPWRIDDAGEIAGDCQTSPFTRQDAVVWNDGRVTVLPTLSGGLISVANGLGPDGLVSGTVTSSSQSCAATWRSGRVRCLGNTGSPQLPSRSFDMNTFGEIIGIGSGSFFSQRVMAWAGQNVTTFAPAYNVSPTSINARGVIVGYGAIVKGDVGGPVMNMGGPGGKFFYLDQSVQGEANGINDEMVVAGYDLDGMTSNAIPWTWHAGRFTYLPFVTGTDFCTTLGINDLGQVVGKCGAGIATLWSGKNAIDLNAASGNDPRWQLLFASSINRSGEIVGYGTFNGSEEAFLLVPSALLPERLVRQTRKSR